MGGLERDASDGREVGATGECRVGESRLFNTYSR